MNRENFISIPPGMHSRIHGQRSLVIHEQNAVAGLTNRLLARLARVVRQVFPGNFYRQHKKSMERESGPMTTKQRSILVNFNRVLIFALTLTGLLMDGYQNSDLPVTLALGIWLWLAVCTRMEANILSRARQHPASSRNRGVRLRRTAGAHHTSANRSSSVASREFWQRHRNATTSSSG